jgi:hypothetical protein
MDQFGLGIDKQTKQNKSKQNKTINKQTKKKEKKRGQPTKLLLSCSGSLNLS